MSETVPSIGCCVTFPGVVSCVLKGKRTMYHFLSLVRCEYDNIQKSCAEVGYVCACSYLYSNLFLHN